MKFLSNLLFQLDEARKYIEDGRLEHLRLAVLLLDNAAEIQMDRRIKEDLSHEDVKERMRSNALALAKHGHPALSLQDLIDWTPLTRSQKARIERFFDAKVDYMVDRGKHLDSSLAVALKHLHKYRNEAYHRAEIRPHTIKTACLILLEINCQMLLTIPEGSRSASSRDDYSWLQERFGVDAWKFDINIPSVIDEIRSGLLPSDEAVANALTDHLQDRLSQLEDGLDFIAENTRLESREAALLSSQFHAEALAGGTSRRQTTMIAPKYSIASIQVLEAQLSDVRRAPSRLEAFNRFASVERDLEPIEECVDRLATEIDWQIQLAIDAALGK